MTQSRTGSAAVGILVVVVAVAALLAIFSIRIVGAGQVGVIHVFGEVDTSPRPSGLLFKLPWASMETMNVRTQQLTMSSAAEDVGTLAGGTVQTLTSEGLTVGVDLTIFYHLNFLEAPVVFRELGPQFEGVILLPAVRGAIRDVVAQFSAEDLYTVARGAVGELILENLVRDLEVRGIIAERVLLRDITLPTQIQQAIERKLAASSPSRSAPSASRRPSRKPIAGAPRLAVNGTRRNSSMRPLLRNICSSSTFRAWPRRRRATSFTCP